MVVEAAPQIAAKLQGSTHRGVQICGRSSALDFNHIYRSYRRRVYALCLRMAGNWADAEDLTQEAFLQLFRKIDTFRGESAFSTWLYRLVVNVALVRFRKKSLWVGSLDCDNVLDEETGNSRESFGSLDTALTNAIDRLSLEIAVGQLPEGFRTVFVLHDVEGYEHNEIARILGVAEGTSKSQLHKARVRLRDLLERGRIREPRTRITRLPRTGGNQRDSRKRRASEGVQFGSESACCLPKGDRRGRTAGREVPFSQQPGRRQRTT